MTKSKDPTNVDVVVYALATLGGAKRIIYSEDIAAKSYELAPSRFSWRSPRHREKGWPDKYIVKTALEDAKKQEYGALVDGAYALDLAKDGWRLTPQGATWFKENSRRIEEHLSSRTQEGSVSTLEKRRFLKRIREQVLYKSFSHSNSLEGCTQYDFTDMLNCSPDAPEEVITSKYSRLRTTAELVGDEEIISFLEECKSTFLDPMRGSIGKARGEGSNHEG